MNRLCFILSKVCAHIQGMGRKNNHKTTIKVGENRFVYKYCVYQQHTMSKNTDQVFLVIINTLKNSAKLQMLNK